jgi:CO/xanthine dehydrogenase FAD-binding subunit
VIAFDFEYHRPDSLAEAAAAYRSLEAAGARPVYYGGGTEILTRAREGTLETGAVIDLKAIPELSALGMDGDALVLGAGLSLAAICEANPWPLLSAVAGRVADHTTRCRITLGGHVAGTIPYREAALALLLGEADAVLEGPSGRRDAPFAAIFDGQLRLEPGEFLAQARVHRRALGLAHAVTKRTRLDWIDYPIATVAAVDDEGEVRVAAAGLIGRGPLRDDALDRIAGERRRSTGERAERAAEVLPAEVLDDIHASAPYRRFVFARALADVLEQLEAPACGR